MAAFTIRGVIVAVGIIATLASAPTVKGEDYQLEKYLRSPGLYYEAVGEAELFSSEWKVVTYVSLSQLGRNLELLRIYMEKTDIFCMKNTNSSWISFTGCLNIFQDLKHNIKRLNNLKVVVTQLVGGNAGGRRTKRGMFNFIREVSKVLFGTLDEKDASYYIDKINKLQEEQSQFLTVAKEHLTLMRSTIAAVNGTLYDVDKNEEILSKSLKELEKYVNRTSGELFRQSSGLSMALYGSEHMLQLNIAIEDSTRQYENLVDAIVQAQHGILKPEIVSPEEIVTLFRNDKSGIPKDLSLPFSLDVAYGNNIIKLVTLDVICSKDVFGYVISLPLSNNIKFDVYHVIPFPIAIRGTKNKFVFYSTEEGIFFNR